MTVVEGAAVVVPGADGSVDAALLGAGLLGSGNGATLIPVELEVTAVDEAGAAGNAWPPMDDPHPANSNAAADTAPQLRSFIRRA